MGLFKTKPTTHEGRLNAAAALAGYAVDAFTNAAADLETAAEEYRTLADEADTQATDLIVVASRARTDAAAAAKRAAKIMELVN